MLDFGEVTAGTAPSLICRIPAGVCNVTLVNSGTVSAYIGNGTAETSGNGAGLPVGGAVSFYTYPTSTGSPLYMIGSGSPATVSWVVSTGS